jgi:hypothetical protein
MICGFCLVILCCTVMVLTCSAKMAVLGRRRGPVTRSSAHDGVLALRGGSAAGIGADKAAGVVSSLDFRFFIAGGVCAAISHGITTPLDVIKVSFRHRTRLSPCISTTLSSIHPLPFI